MPDDPLPRGLGERLLALRSFSLLAPLPASDLGLIARLSRERDFQTGEILAVEGEAVQAVLLIISGSATLSRRGTPVKAVGAFDTVGLWPIAAGTSHHLTAVADEPIHALELDADMVDEVLEDDCALFVRVLRLAAASPASAGPPKRSGVDQTAPIDERLLDDLAGPLAPARKLLLLRQTSLFRTAPVDGLAGLAKRLELVRVSIGDRVEAGGGSGTFSVVVAGRADVIRGDFSGDSTSTAATNVTVGVGDVVGALEALTSNGTSLWIRAQTELYLLRASASDLLDVLEDHQAMGRRLMAEILGLNAAR